MANPSRSAIWRCLPAMAASRSAGPSPSTTPADAALEIKLINPPAISTILQAAMPEKASEIRTAFIGLGFLGPEPSILFRIVKGRPMLLGFALGESSRCGSAYPFGASSGCSTTWRPKSGTSTSCPASMIERRTPRVCVNRSNSFCPSPPADRALQQGQVFEK